MRTRLTPGKVHYAPGLRVRNVACRERKAGLLTENVLQVTCGRCMRTQVFQIQMRLIRGVGS